MLRDLKGRERIKVERSFSWSKPNKPQLIGRKCVDLSLMDNGETGIPVAFQKYFDAANAQKIAPGKKKEVKFHYYGLTYSAAIKNIARKDSANNSYKIVSISPELRVVFQQKFERSYRYLKNEFAMKSTQKLKKVIVKLPEELEQYLLFYETGKPFEYRIDFENFVLNDEEIKQIEEEVYAQRIEGNLIREGLSKRFLTNRYERNAQNRLKAIQEHGISCIVCGFNFEKVYGELGKDFIEIHHAVPISQTGEIFIDPVKDLVPLCANCHRMIHRKHEETLTIKELKAIYNSFN